ncbi:DUF1127 domain-containing protein [Phaeobacter sp. B1627]|uniref:DUF1127 domain-containing protein n=1 Tax=Phaeobacter sp. B1627 TaxID=2583809 RepID=UPI001119CAD1|nr:DUF1127 domain-containing protein [Phaeobacter sp. B1627]TNJ48627.1 DUF1127 domain-containing protein [Phaeobacter sp. B1627]
MADSLSRNIPLRPRRASLVAGIVRAFSVQRQRRKLLTLDDRQLKDIGLTRRDVEAEARRRVWDAPQHWQV